MSSIFGLCLIPSDPESEVKDKQTYYLQMLRRYTQEA